MICDNKMLRHHRRVIDNQPTSSARLSKQLCLEVKHRVCECEMSARIPHCTGCAHNNDKVMSCQSRTREVGFVNCDGHLFKALGDNFTLFFFNNPSDSLTPRYCVCRTSFYRCRRVPKSQQ